MTHCLIRVTRTDEYLFDMSRVDGRTPEQIVEDFFVDHDINHSHYARDYARVGGASTLVATEIVKAGEVS